MKRNKSLIASSLFLVASTIAQAAEILNVSEKNLDSTIEKSNKPLIIKAYAPWCGMCRKNKPVYEKLAEEMGHSYLFTQFDIDAEPKLAAKFGVTGVPTFIFVKDKRVVGSESGAKPYEELKAAFEKYVGPS
jgi:thioredoxin